MGHVIELKVHQGLNTEEMQGKAGTGQGDEGYQ